DRSTRRTQAPGRDTDQRRLAGTVRTDQPGHDPRGHAERHTSKDVPAAVSGHDVLDDEAAGAGFSGRRVDPAHHAQTLGPATRRCRRSSTTKNGPPSSAVIAPTGISSG